MNGLEQLDVSAMSAGEAQAALRDVAVIRGATDRIEAARTFGYKVYFGDATRVSEQYGLGTFRGTHGIGHTRMATESAVTTLGAHPFSTARR